jgi:hypothetical protein
MDIRLPEVVKAAMEIILDSETFQDYRLVGNVHGTTLVLRYTRLDMVSEHRHSPLWQHRSRVNLTRDNMRLNAWIKDNQGCDIINAMDNSVKQIWQYDSPHMESPTHELNVNAPEFKAKASTVLNPTEKIDNVAQTEDIRTTSNIGTQTYLAANTVTTGCQYECASRSIGVRCNIVPTTKNKYVQATAMFKSQGVSAVVGIHHSGTQCEKTKTSLINHDVEVEGIHRLKTKS